ncbi:Uncharacterised protein [Bordetella pertussis]|nr:Uncharacterised protein [Bordetella pertussis]
MKPKSRILMCLLALRTGVHRAAPQSSHRLSPH